MYAAPGSRGGVLEPSGIISIKYRQRHQLASMHRLDDKIISLVAERNAAESANDFAAVADATKRIAAREKVLFPVYRQVRVRLGAALLRFGGVAAAAAAACPACVPNRLRALDSHAHFSRSLRLPPPPHYDPTSHRSRNTLRTSTIAPAAWRRRA